MARPLRIEYEDAYYHVMNRGAGYCDIFQHDDHRDLFLDLLREIHDMFRIEIHAYCLMSNHYHLLLSTPDANLSRAMRHLNGVYTQRYNRMEKTDGALYRGRYNAILVNADSYLLSVSRYIHRNPVDAGLVKKPDDYLWSSYNSFIGKEIAPSWLNLTQTLEMIGVRNLKKRYQVFVEMGVDQETVSFYNNNRHSAIFGQEQFVNSVAGKIKEDPEIPSTKALRRAIEMEVIVDVVAKTHRVKKNAILTSRRGRGQKNVARSISLYLCRKYAGLPLNKIADYFGLNHYGSVSGLINRFEKQLEDSRGLKRKVKGIIKIINEKI